MVGVLIFIDQHVPESPAVVLGYVGEQLHQRNRGADEIVKIEGGCSRQPSLVFGVSLGDGGFHVIARLRCEGLVIDQLVLRIGHLRQERTRWVTLGIQIQIPDHHLHQTQGVRLVVDAEGSGHTEPAGFLAQDANAGAVEGGHQHGSRGRTHKFRHTILHLRGSLIGEGDGEDLPGIGVAGGQQVRDPARENPGLPRARSRDDQQRATAMFDRRLLRGVEVVHQCTGIHHRMILGSGCDVVVSTTSS